MCRASMAVSKRILLPSPYIATAGQVISPASICQHHGLVPVRFDRLRIGIDVRILRQQLSIRGTSRHRSSPQRRWRTSRGARLGRSADRFFSYWTLTEILHQSPWARDCPFHSTRLVRSWRHISAFVTHGPMPPRHSRPMARFNQQRRPIAHDGLCPSPRLRVSSLPFTPRWVPDVMSRCSA